MERGSKAAATFGSKVAASCILGLALPSAHWPEASRLQEWTGVHVVQPCQFCPVQVSLSEIQPWGFQISSHPAHNCATVGPPLAVQTNLGDNVGLVPDHGNKTSITIK